MHNVMCVPTCATLTSYQSAKLSAHSWQESDDLCAYCATQTTEMSLYNYYIICSADAL